MSDEQMFQVILDTMTRTETRLDEMGKDHFASMLCVQRDLGKIRADLRGHKVKWSVITGCIALAVSGAVAWAAGQLGR